MCYINMYIYSSNVSYVFYLKIARPLLGGWPILNQACGSGSSNYINDAMLKVSVLERLNMNDDLFVMPKNKCNYIIYTHAYVINL